MARTYCGGYRGRRSGRDWLKYLVLALVLVLVSMATLFLLGLGPYEPGDGPLPQIKPGEGEQVEPAPAPESEPVPEPVPEPQPAPFVMSAVGVEVEALLDGSWRTTLAQEGGNALVVNMKPDSGELGWISAHPLAAKANHKGEGVNDVIRRLTGEEIYTVARISCFRDELLAQTHAYCIRSNSDYRWKDFGGVHWVNLTVPEVSGYIAALCGELAELGFDEILLDNCGYPQDGTGQMGWIKKGPAYDVNNLDGAVTAFLDQVGTALEGYDVVLSIRTNAQAAANGGDLTGVTAAVLEEYAGHIWMSELDSDLPLAETLSLNGVTDVGERLVTQSMAVSQLDSWNQAVLPF